MTFIFLISLHLCCAFFENAELVTQQHVQTCVRKSMRISTLPNTGDRLEVVSTRCLKQYRLDLFRICYRPNSNLEARESLCSHQHNIHSTVTEPSRSIRAVLARSPVWSQSSLSGERNGAVPDLTAPSQSPLSTINQLAALAEQTWNYTTLNNIYNFIRQAHKFVILYNEISHLHLCSNSDFNNYDKYNSQNLML